MRLLFGMILGFALTVGGAYISDSAKSGAGCPPDGELGRGRKERR